MTIKIQADLTDKQKRSVREWVKPPKYSGQDMASRTNAYTAVTKPISDHVFGNKTRLELPEHVEHSVIAPDKKVGDYLESQHFLTRHDLYKKGITHHYSDDERKRSLRIGTVLEKTKAPEAIKKAYMNDPFRSSSKSHLKTTISRHPYDVAGMSTDRGWTSCLNFNGAYSEDLPYEIKHGTHVAYLHHKTDKTIAHPVARIALRAFSHPNHPTLLRAESKTYGTANPQFDKTVSKWAEKNFPPKPNVVYTRNPNVYNDSHESPVILHHTNGPELFKNNTVNQIESAADHNLLKDHPLRYTDVEHVLPHIRTYRNSGVGNHIVDNIAKLDLSKLANHDNPAVRYYSIDRWKELSDEDKNRLKKDDDRQNQVRLKTRGYI